VRFSDLAINQPVGSDTLRAQALTRARAIAPWLDQEILNLRTGLGLGYSAREADEALALVAAAKDDETATADGSPLEQLRIDSGW